MKSLAHTPHCRRAAERLAEVCLHYRSTLLHAPEWDRPKRYFALAHARGLPSVTDLDHPNNFYNLSRFIQFA